jgi:glycosyltransferase involved in cell wall biosynthesis
VWQAVVEEDRRLAAHLAFVAPPGAVSGAEPTGGNIYDRRMVEGLRAAGLQVTFTAAAGSWPRPSREDRAGLARVLDQISDDAPVVLDGLIACSAPDVLAGHAERLRLVVLVHMPLGDDVGLPAQVAAELADRERRTLRMARAVVATSNATADRLRRSHGLDVQVVEPGVDPAPGARPSTRGDRLLCVASVAPVKGQDVLVDALAALTDLPWHCRCVGAERHADFAASVRRRIADLGLTDRIVLAGAQTDDQLEASYAESDLLVLPSRAESYGMVVVEALARGIPVVASAVGGLLEAVGTTSIGPPGILVPPDDPPALAVAVRTWLTSRAERNRLRGAAHERRTALEPWSAAARRFATVLRRLTPSGTAS